MLKKILVIIILVLGILSRTTHGARASSHAIDQGLNYLKANQDETGKILGFGGESQWAAIAFAAHLVDSAAVYNGGVSLKDYLLSHHPESDASATEWERRILAIVAIGEEPTNFGGINYVEHLIALQVDGQLGEVTLLNDDIFGVLALIASDPLGNSSIIEGSLDFIIDHQAVDGGFSWSTESCVWCGADNNDTAAALQALIAATEHGYVHSDLELSIMNAKQYLLSTQKDTGGFGYDAASEADGASTAWSLMALNALGEQESFSAQQAAAWLLANQETDGGFHWMSGFGSDTATTSHALIALSGHSWLLGAMNPVIPLPIPSSTPTVSPMPTPSLTPTPIVTPLSIVTPTPSSTPSPSVSPSPISLARLATGYIPVTSAQPSATPEVLGEKIDTLEKLEATGSSEVTVSKNSFMKREIWFSLGSLGAISMLVLVLKMWEHRKEN